MTLTIDGPVAVRINPASEKHSASVVLDLLGGSLWFAREACPSSLAEGTRKSAVVEVALRNIRQGDFTRTVFSPVRLVSVQ